MVRRSFSVVLSVKRGLPQEDIIDWIDESLNGVVEFNSFNTLAVTYYPVRELIYGQVIVWHYVNISESRIKECLSSAPDHIKVLEFAKLENQDLVVDMPDNEIAGDGRTWRTARY